MPLQGAILVCYGWGEGDDQVWGRGRGAIAGCHCSVLWCGRANFGGVDVVTLQGAIVVCYLWGSGRGARVPLQGAVDVVPLLGARRKNCFLLSGVYAGIIGIFMGFCYGIFWDSLWDLVGMVMVERV